MNYVLESPAFPCTQIRATFAQSHTFARLPPLGGPHPPPLGTSRRVPLGRSPVGGRRWAGPRSAAGWQRAASSPARRWAGPWGGRRQRGAAGREGLPPRRKGAGARRSGRPRRGETRPYLATVVTMATAGSARSLRMRLRRCRGRGGLSARAPNDRQLLRDPNRKFPPPPVWPCRPAEGPGPSRLWQR